MVENHAFSLHMSDERNAKNFYREMFALSSINHAKRCVDRLLTADYDEDPVASSALWDSFVVAYSKPFTSNGGLGPISEKVVPKDLKTVHESIRDIFRNRIIGHLDSDLREDGGRRFHELLVRKENGRLMAFPLKIVPDANLIIAAKQLAYAVFQNVEIQTKSHRDKITEFDSLNEGEYIFDFNNPAGQMCIPQDSKDESRLE